MSQACSISTRQPYGVTRVLECWHVSRSTFYRKRRNHYELVAVMHDAAFTQDFRRRLFEHDLPHSRRIAPQDVEGLLDIEDWVRGYLRYVVDGWY